MRKNYRHASTFLIAIGIVLSATGCENNPYRVDPIITYNPKAKSIAPYEMQGKENPKWDWKKADTERGPFKRNLLRINPWTFKEFEDKDPLYKTATTHADPDVRRSARDRLQMHIMNLSDQIVSQHNADIGLTEDTMNVTLGTSGLVLDALGATTGNAGTKSGLAAASGAVSGTRSLINEEVFANAFANAISAAIRIKREEIRLNLAIKRKDRDIHQYPVDEAINDAIEYHESGSFYRGLELVQKETHRALQEKLEKDVKPKAEILTIMRAKGSTFNEARKLQAIEAWLRMDSSHATMLDKWLQSKEIEKTSSAWILEEQKEDLVAEAIGHFKITIPSTSVE